MNEFKPEQGWAAKEFELVRRQINGPASYFFPKSLAFEPPPVRPPEERGKPKPR